MALVYGDLHIHIGRTKEGKAVKITASPALTLENIIRAAEQKGLRLVGIVDAACRGVLEELWALANTQILQPIPDGGYRWGKVTIFLGSEVEIACGQGRAAHFLGFFPSLQAVQEYTSLIWPAVTNSHLSTQRLKMDADSWLQAVLACGGVAVAAHAFTPHKGVYGSCVRSLGEMFRNPELIVGLELGLSADTSMALGISDTHRHAYLANSDAHSPGTIAREFTAYDLPNISFRAWRDALMNGGKGVAAVIGMDPRLGKYYRSFCSHCMLLATGDDAVLACPQCGRKMITGVWDRVREIADCRGQAPRKPPYQVHIPLAMLPGVGPITYGKLLREVGTELEILYHASLDEISRAAGEQTASCIRKFREGRFHIQPGGGGRYGKVTWKVTQTQ